MTRARMPVIWKRSSYKQYHLSKRGTTEYSKITIRYNFGLTAMRLEERLPLFLLGPAKCSMTSQLLRRGWCAAAGMEAVPWSGVSGGGSGLAVLGVLLSVWGSNPAPGPPTPLVAARTCCFKLVQRRPLPKPARWMSCKEDRNEWIQMYCSEKANLFLFLYIVYKWVMQI